MDGTGRGRRCANEKVFALLLADPKIAAREKSTMVREIIRDPLILAKPGDPAAGMDVLIARDLMDTLEANRDRCVGMATNMIGFSKRIIAVRDGVIQFVMFNPVIIRKEGAFEAEEGCLSLEHTRKTTRYQRITVAYQDQLLRKKQGVYEGWTAQIIQHEVDHLEGRII